MTTALPTSPLTDELGANGRQASASSSRVLPRRRCLNCGEFGHYRKTCTTRISPTEQLELTRAEVARLQAEVAFLVTELEEERIDRAAMASRTTLELVTEVELTCIHCGQSCERATVHRDRTRDQGHTPAVYGEESSTLRASAPGARVPGRAA